MSSDESLKPLKFQGFRVLASTRKYRQLPLHAAHATTLEISLRESARGFESHPLRQLTTAGSAPTHRDA